MIKHFLFGETILQGRLSPDQAHAICVKAREKQNRMCNYPQDKILRILGKAKALWADKQSTLRKSALEHLHITTGFSQEMLELGMDELVWSLDPEILEKKYLTETNQIPLVYGEKYNRINGTSLTNYPLGTLFHVLSGNVFLVGPGSLIEGLVTGNVNILKLPSEETFFLPYFLESLKAVDDDGILTGSIATVNFSSSENEIMNIFKNQADGIVVWGGESAAKAYRNDLPARTKLILFGPKLSFSLVTGAGVSELGIKTVAENLAKELVIWDQQACTAPQVCYVEKGMLPELMSQTSEALKSLQKKLPPGSVNPDAAVEIRKIRGVAEVRESLSSAILIDSGHKSLSYTLYSDTNLELEPSPLSRTIKFVEYKNPTDVFNSICELRGYLQTVGIACGSKEWSFFRSELSKIGALRILELGQMSGGEIDDPHDGLFDLPQLVNTVVSRRVVGNTNKLSPFYTNDRAANDEIKSIKLRKLIDAATNSSFYKERFQNISINNINDISKLPILTREQWESKMPPNHNASKGIGGSVADCATISPLETRKTTGGFVTRSGGSTGAPKFSTFDQNDWEKMLESASNMFSAAGLNREDKIANFFSAGDLYGSFISFSHVNYQLGCQSFGFAHETNPENFLSIAKNFGINVIQGTPVNIVRILRAANAIDPSFEIEKVLYAGMPMSEVDRIWLKQNLKVKLIISVIGTTEANHLGYQCQYLEGNLHHIADDYNHIEILGEKNEVLPFGLPGRISVTCLEKTNFPVIRYLNGDGGFLKEHDCKCGNKSPVLAYLGRWDDIICIGNMNLVKADLERALAEIQPSQVQLIAKFINGVDHLDVLIELDSPNSISVEKVKNLLKEKVTDMNHFLSIGNLTLSVSLLKIGSIPTNARTGKIKGIVDERQ